MLVKYLQTIIRICREISLWVLFSITIVLHCIVRNSSFAKFRLLLDPPRELSNRIIYRWRSFSHQIDSFWMRFLFESKKLATFLRFFESIIIKNLFTWLGILSFKISLASWVASILLQWWFSIFSSLPKVETIFPIYLK